MKPIVKEVSLEELMKRAKAEDYLHFVQEKIRFNQELKEELTAYLKAKVSTALNETAKEVVAYGIEKLIENGKATR